jgi:hypothetical protein
VFGSETEQANLGPQLSELAEKIGVIRAHLDATPSRLTSTDQSAERRWRGLAASVLPSLTRADDWPGFAAELDIAAASGIEVAEELPRLAVRATMTAGHGAPALTGGALDPVVTRPVSHDAAMAVYPSIGRPPATGPRP